MTSTTTPHVPGARGRPVASLCAALLLGLLSSCAGCGGPPVTVCTNDEQCRAAGDVFSICLVEEGVCGCGDDRACETTEFCNALGRCQAKIGCTVNDDCTQDPEGGFCGGQFCDTLTSRCVSNCQCDPDEGELCCTLDSHCAYGSICNVFDGQCVPGCRGDGDCRLGEGCVGAGLGGQLGECAAGICTANNLCQFGETCDLEEGDCVFDTRGPYCSSCTGGVASTDCGTRANYCLTDSSDPTGQSSFCGVDCSKQQLCPFGYECHDVIIIPPAAPFCGAEACVKQAGEQQGKCSQNVAVTCTTDDDCPIGLPGGDCPRADVGNCINDQQQECEQDSECCEDPAVCPAGSCVKQQCRGGEGDAFGYCTCTRDLDCPRDECVGADLASDPQVRGNCRLSGHACFADVDCDVIACVDGGCRIGANCAPANDRNCRELVITP